MLANERHFFSLLTERTAGIPAAITENFLSKGGTLLPYAILSVYKEIFETESIFKFLDSDKSKSYLPEEEVVDEAVVNENGVTELVIRDDSFLNYDIRKGDVILVVTNRKPTEGFVVFKLCGNYMFAHATRLEEGYLMLEFGNDLFPCAIYWREEYLDKLEVFGMFVGTKKDPFEGEIIDDEAREIYSKLAYIFAEESFVPEEIVKDFLAPEGKVMPYDIAEAISRFIYKPSYEFARFSDRDEYLYEEKEKDLRLYDYGVEGAVCSEVRDNSLTPIGINMGDIIYIQPTENITPEELADIVYYECYFQGYVTKNEDGSLNIRLPNPKYYSFHVAPEERENVIVNSKVIAVRKFRDDSDTTGEIQKL